MSMAVSLKKSTNKTNINHNNREMTDRQRERNPHIDYERSVENQYVVRGDLRKLYQREFGEALENYNAKQTRNDRKIDDYYKHIEKSKKTALQQEMIIQVGDKDDFSSREKVALANEVLEEWFHDFEERNPNLKVYNAAIHNDEASPHMHLNFVPVAEGYKRGLERQVSFDKAIKQQDATLDKTRPFDDWREKEVQVLTERLQERGIKRKFVGTNEYKDVNEYKEKQDELQAINEKIQAKRENFEKIQSVMPDEPEEIPFVKKEKNLFQKETGNYVLSAKQYERLNKQIEYAYFIKRDHERMRTGEFAKRNKDLQQSAKQAVELAKGYENENKELKRENQQLKSENITLKTRVKNLQHEIGQIYVSTKNYLKDNTKDLKSFKNIFKGLVGRFKGEYDQNKENIQQATEKSFFEEIHDKAEKREIKKDKKMDMER